MINKHSANLLFLIFWTVIGGIGLLMILLAMIDITPMTLIPQPTPYPSGWVYDPN